VLVSRVLSAQVPIDSVRALDAINRDVVRLGRRYGESIWPGYRPDTIPVAYVFPRQGTALFNWRGQLPAGYQPVPGIPNVGWLSKQNISASNTGTSIDGRNVAQVAISSLRIEEVLPLTFHEAMHAFEHSVQAPGMRFGHGENSFYVASYPIFDARNEFLWAVEGELLGEAVTATSAQKKRQLAREFVAVRRQRESLLDPSYAEFEQASELNEGIAEYALVRALQLLAMDTYSDTLTRAGARTILAKRITDLAGLTQNVTQSFRLRFYRTGPAQALLLDAIAGPSWKSRLMFENQSLQDALAGATGLDDPQRAAFRAAVAGRDTTSAMKTASARVASLVALRKRQVDSVLSTPGVLLEISAHELPDKDFNACGFDPQNHLQVSPTVQMQTRWWRPCAGGVSSEFAVPSVHDDETGTVRAVIGSLADVKLTVAGKPVTITEGLRLDRATDVRLEASRANVNAKTARVSFDGRTLRIVALPSA
jgi:hypothetical protein